MLTDLSKWIIRAVACFLAGFAIDFVLRFVRPAIRLRGSLKRCIERLEGIRDRSKGQVVALEEIREALTVAGLGHLWAEYAKTLHAQREVGNLGTSRIVRWRSTALSEAFLNDQTVVDSRLKTEYFKHLPGILTGIGIIGTFSGLISGLSQFKPSSDNGNKIYTQLDQLLKSVGEAFVVSASAISLAILFTLIEKWLVSTCYKQAETIRELIDGLFTSGAGEEYLERLVIASETSATQAAQIKDALVADLKEILAAQTAQQIEAQSRQTTQMSGDVGRAIADNLGAPIQAISEAVRGVSSNQGDAVNRILTDVLASFSGQMQELFGGQLHGMSELLRETTATMQATAQQFGQLAANMDAAGTGTVEAMGQRMNHALDAVEARQQVMNGHMAAFVEQIRSLVAESQSESSKKLQEVLAAMGDQVAGVVSELRRQNEVSTESHGQRMEHFEKSAGEAIGSLSAQMERLLAQSVETNQSLQTTVSRLASATDKAMADLKSGAVTLALAANDFAKAGQGVSQTLIASSKSVETIKTASEALASAAAGTKTAFGDYARTRDTFASMISDLKLTVETAKREAAMTSDLVKRLEAAAAQLAKAQGQSEDYLEGVNDVLVKAHESFALNVERTLREANRQFQGELSTAVQNLSGAIKDLGDVFDEIPARKR